jgi:rubrerythrin
VGETHHIEKQILTIIRSAIEDEIQAQERYARGEELAVAPEIKSLFAKLKKEEKGHERILKEFYHQIEEKIEK